MDLSGLLPLLEDLSGYRRLKAALVSGERRARALVLEEAKAALLAGLARTVGTPLLVITARAGQAALLAEQLQVWLGPGAAVLLFPEPGVLPYERLSPDVRITQQRLRVLRHLAAPPAAHGAAPVVVTPAAALLAPTLLPQAFRSACVTLTQGGRFSWEQMAQHWLKLGYEPVATVEQPGQFARRGGVVDCFPPHLDEPFRLDLFGQEIESIRAFDPATQRSTALLSEVTVTPARELLGPPWGAAPAALDLEGCAPEARAAMAQDIQRLLEGGQVAAAWHYTPLFNRSSLAEYLPPGALAVVDEPQEALGAVQELREEAAELRAELEATRDLPVDFPEALLDWGVGEERLAARGRRLDLHRWGGEGAEEVEFAPVPGYAGRLRELLTHLRRMAATGERVVLVSHQSQRLSELLEQQDVLARPVDLMPDMPPPGGITLVQGVLSGGWRIPPASDGGAGAGMTLLTDAEVFGFVKESRRSLPRRSQRRENPLAGLAPGDYVVHVEHGIGRFAGAVVMAGGEIQKEYLHLEYAEGGRLYVPADQVDRVARYVGPGGYAPALSRLGTLEWERAKERVRRAAAASARELLETAAARQVVLGRAYAPDTAWQQELEASFPYLETPDQLDAVRDVKRDMEQPLPMDRLLCGDVGYGKTEVALRAAFKAVQEGAQAGVLVPTTVLAQQHYQTFTQRLGAFPVNVEVLSRFRSEREQQAVLQGLRTGTVDIVIGTHRLLQKDVAFKDLGLFVVDEEQRFGVLHKEHFKRLRREVDVLTLSATPIPRTLYMALVGVRDMSVMDTPPEERLPIKTYIMEYDEAIIRHAVLRELEQGGQVFFVHNRVQNIAHMAYELRHLLPEASIGVAHGQMPEEALEQAMLDFVGGKVDVLVCTTIIESGLDLPNVNTIIINNADRLGLAQLYQLRGRVGRGTRRAYAYLLHTRNKALTETAQKRLQAIFEATELGAGYFIAMKDLEIRGAGNLLGVEQSGHIGAVGFDLYCRILAAAVEDVKAEQEGRTPPSRIPAPPAVTLALRTPAYLPEDYVPDLEVRLDCYRRMAAATGLEEVEELAQELRDRFGSWPPVVANLLFAVRVRLLAIRAGVAVVEQEEDHVIVRLLEGLQVDARPLQGQAGVRPGHNQVRVDASGSPARWQPLLEQTLARMAGVPAGRGDVR
ncbi:MAG: transcription-repair coupling factor [Chloroflexi bacterium]|nr:transcription-repair coupling factor [Chloroflexota bacterium]